GPAGQPFAEQSVADAAGKVSRPVPQYTLIHDGTPFWHPSGVLDVLNSTGGLRYAATSGYSLAGFQPAPSGLHDGYKNAPVAQPPACGVGPTRGSDTPGHRRKIGLHPGGVPAGSEQNNLRNREIAQ